MGCIVQFILKSREIGRKEVAHSEEVKKEISKEEEVESARALFGEEASDDVNREAESVDHVDETEETIE